MTDLELQEENFPNYEQSLVFGNDKSGKKALIYIPISFGIRLGDGNILIESNYNLDFIEITYINGEDGDCTDLYLIVGLMIDDIETNIFFGFFTKSDNKYIIYHNKCFCISSIYNRDIQQPECLKFLGNFTWAICLKKEIHFIQITQNLLDAFANSRSCIYIDILNFGVSFNKRIINLRLIHRDFSHINSSTYSIVNYDNQISIECRNNYQDMIDTFYKLNIRIGLIDERRFSNVFQYSLIVYRHFRGKHNGDTDDADSIDLKEYDRSGDMQFHQE
jgi:hypothetical protein